MEADERQPLLAREIEIDSQLEANRAELGQPEGVVRRSKLKIASYIILTLVSAFVLAVSIKGFIDADDVEARIHTYTFVCIII